MSYVSAFTFYHTSFIVFLLSLLLGCTVYFTVTGKKTVKSLHTYHCIYFIMLGFVLSVNEHHLCGKPYSPTLPTALLTWALDTLHT